VQGLIDDGFNAADLVAIGRGNALRLLSRTAPIKGRTHRRCATEPREPFRYEPVPAFASRRT
jgi:hypothetical protein